VCVTNPYLGNQKSAQSVAIVSIWVSARRRVCMRVSACKRVPKVSTTHQKHTATHRSTLQDAATHREGDQKSAQSVAIVCMCVSACKRVPRLCMCV